MHKLTADDRPKVERVIAFKQIFLDFKETKDIRTAMEGLKICLSLVNDVMEYTQPIALDPYYLNYAKSFINNRYGYWEQFEINHAHFLENELSNDLAPRFYCKDWFSAIVGVLTFNGLTLEEIEHIYYDHLDGIGTKQITIFEFV